MGQLQKLLGLLFILQFSGTQVTGDKSCFIAGREYKCLQGDFFRNCVNFECTCDGTWWSSDQYRLRTCKECRLNNDPHITTFDGARYDWHGDCTYVLAEEEGGVSYVYSKFTKHGRASLVDDVTFKPRVGPIIKIQNPSASHSILTYGSPYDAEVVINGYIQRITTPERQMQVLKGPEHQEHHVLAYYLGGCLHIIAVDEQDFLVKICKHSVRVFSAKKKNSGRNISGMCGSPDDGGADTDLKLRNGTVVENPGGCCFDHIVDDIFAHDWEVPSAPCDDASGRRKRSTSSKSGKKLCEASETQKAEYYRVCTDVIKKEKSLSEEMKNEFIDTCAFDQCIITQTGADSDTIKEWLDQYTELAKQQVFEQEHQDDMSEEDYEYIDYLNDYYDDLETEDPDSSTAPPLPVVTCNISKVIEAGNKQYAFFNTCPKSYSKARDFCKLYGWELATPNDHFKEFNDRMPESREYWLDVQPDTSLIKNGRMPWFWQTTPKKQQSGKDQWKVGYYNVATIKSGTDCASLFKNDGLLAYDCERKQSYACESFHFLNVQRSEIKEDVEMHVQKREAPLKNH